MHHSISACQVKSFDQGFGAVAYGFNPDPVLTSDSQCYLSLLGSYSKMLNLAHVKYVLMTKQVDVSVLLASPSSMKLVSTLDYAISTPILSDHSIFDVQTSACYDTLSSMTTQVPPSRPKVRVSVQNFSNMVPSVLESYFKSEQGIWSSHLHFGKPLMGATSLLHRCPYHQPTSIGQVQANASMSGFNDFQSCLMMFQAISKHSTCHLTSLHLVATHLDIQNVSRAHPMTNNEFVTHMLTLSSTKTVF